MKHKRYVLLIPLLLLASCNGKGKEPDRKKVQVYEDRTSGFYNEPFYLSFSASIEADIFYTLDGKEPSEESNRYINPILIKTAVKKIIIIPLRKISLQLMFICLKAR